MLLQLGNVAEQRSRGVARHAQCGVPHGRRLSRSTRSPTRALDEADVATERKKLIDPELVDDGADCGSTIQRLADAALNAVQYVSDVALYNCHRPVISFGPDINSIVVDIAHI